MADGWVVVSQPAVRPQTPEEFVYVDNPVEDEESESESGKSADPRQAFKKTDGVYKKKKRRRKEVEEDEDGTDDYDEDEGVEEKTDKGNI